jgi:hypothetical protein
METGMGPDDHDAGSARRSVDQLLAELQARQSQHDEHAAVRRYDFGLPPPRPSDSKSIVLPTTRSQGHLDRPWRVFLSHTSDLREHPNERSFVAAAEAAVVRAGHAVTDMAYFVARDSEPAAYCARMVAQANLYVGIIGHRYGAEVRGCPHQSYTELEFETATQLEVPRLVFLLHDSAAPPPDADHSDRQVAFRRRLQDSGVTTVWVHSPGELELSLLHALVELGAAASSQGHVSRYVGASIIVPATADAGKLDDVERRRFLQWAAAIALTAPDDLARLAGGTDTNQVLSAAGRPTPDQVERLRQSLDEAISDGTVNDAVVTDWEQLVLAHGRATRDRPSDLMLADLSADLIELRRVLRQCRSSSTMQRLTRVTAQMAGLMCLTLVKLDEHHAFRSWARTARIAAQEAGDPVTQSWVRAHEAYGHYYAGDLHSAIRVAADAQAVAAQTSGVGVPLAAALEARAHAARGDHRETKAALGRAEAALARLGPDDHVPSAFGYNEAQFRFHESSALTHLRDTKAAWNAQERAMTLCLPTDYTDRTLTQLDRAICILYEGDPTGATAYAHDAIVGLTNDQRRGIITSRAQDILTALPAGTASLPAVRHLREVVMDPDGRDR